jgi:hypothetical protein
MFTAPYPGLSYDENEEVARCQDSIFSQKYAALMLGLILLCTVQEGARTASFTQERIFWVVILTIGAVACFVRGEIKKHFMLRKYPSLREYYGGLFR